MKNDRLTILFPALCACMLSVKGGTPVPPSFEAGKIISMVVCKTDATQSYAVYIPVKGNKAALPVVYCFDPHGDGSLPLKKYKTLADAHGFILIGSNNSKNGNDWATTENIWRNLFNDTRARLKINPERIYTCGFSGGAKVAGYVAIQHPEIKAVIAGGAGLPDGTTAGNFSFSFTALAGEGDMNMTDLVAFSRGLDNTQTRHRIIFFDGKHEWAPAGAMDLAFTGLQMDAMLQKTQPRDNALISLYIAKSKNRLAADRQARQLIKADQECQLSINLLDGLTGEVAWFKQQAFVLANDPEYRQQRQQREELLAKEQRIKEEYMQQFQRGDMRYWTTTIHDLTIKANLKNAESPLYQRLLAYLSLAFYSISNHLISSNENSGARHFVELYKMADPTNSEAWHFSAILDTREGNPAAAQADLQMAKKYGYRDK